MYAARTIEELGHLNRMSIRRFMEIVAKTPLTVLCCHFRTIGNLFGLVTRLKHVREHLVTRLVAVLGKN
jgi:hypothetical protein